MCASAPGRPPLPVYDYRCAANGRTVEVTHPVGTRLRIWGEVCYVARIPLGDTDPAAPVERIITRAPGVGTRPSNAELADAGFTKLVRRGPGEYENVTARGDAPRAIVDHDATASGGASEPED